MNRYYLDKTNVENQFMFYRLIQILLDQCLMRIGMRSYRMNKEFRRRLYLEFVKFDGVYIQALCVPAGIMIKFTLKEKNKEMEFGSLTFESAGVSELYSLQ